MGFQLITLDSFITANRPNTRPTRYHSPLSRRIVYPVTFRNLRIWYDAEIVCPKFGDDAITGNGE
ncbi:hypothetical protein BC2230_180055 [Burkholderia cepacia]